MEMDRITVRLKEGQLNKLRRLEKKLKMNKSQIIRYLIENFDEDKLLSKDELKRLNYELSKIGININQLARYSNKNKKEYLETLDLIAELKGKLKKVL